MQNTQSTTVNSLLKKHFGFDTFRPNQQEIINTLMKGNDVLAIMPTGGGKSLCYQLPALAMQGTAIVISPLIALMKDQVDALKANGISAAYFNSSQPQEEQQAILELLITGKLKLVYVAPESIWNITNYLNKITINLIAIDEAHCISSWGHDFRPAYTQLRRLKNQFAGTPLIALTATADRATQDDITKQLGIPYATRFISSFDRPNIFIDIRPGQQRIQQIYKFLSGRGLESGIIYCLSRKGTESLAKKLNAKGYNAAAYHAGLTPEERSNIQDDFINDRTPIITATIAFGMGIDKSNVRWVIHYNMPKNIEGYYQEIGRGGRDGLKARALMFYSYADVLLLRKFAEDSETEEVQLAKLERMQQFAEALSCRRKALLNYFGEHISKDCGNCDICNKPPTYFDGTILAQKICSAIARVREQEPIGVIIDILRGSQNAQIVAKGYQQVKTFGAAKNVAWKDLQQYVIQLLNQGILEIWFHENGRLVLTPAAKKVLFENKKVQLAKQQQQVDKPLSVETSTVKKTGLLEKLKTLRSTYANELGVPAYVVFSDASLQDMVLKKPTSIAAFSKISGVGQAKLDKYGAIFIKTIAKFIDSKDVKIPTHEYSFQLYKEGFSPKEIAAKRGITKNTVHNHLLKMHEQGNNINIRQFITNEEINLIKKAKKELNNPEELKPFFDYFDAKMPYYKIKYGLYLSQTKKTATF